MRVFSPQKLLQKITNNKLVVTSAVLVVASLGLMLGGAAPKASASCSNDIICGGYSSRDDFVHNVKGSSELQHVYAHYGLTSSLYDNFQNSARAGYTTRSGNIYLNDGTKVGKDASSIGRLASYQGSGYYTEHIAGAGTFYGNSNDRAFAAGTSQISVNVLLDGNGKAIFVVMKSCGNPVHFTPTPPPAPPKPTPTPPKPPTPPAPTYSCVLLTGALTDRGTNTYQLSVKGAYANGATPVSADFTFGDGKSQAGVKLTTTATTTHAYPSVNKVYAASAILHFVANGKAVTAPATRACTVAIPVTIPSCQALSGTIIDAQKYEAQFTATAVLNGRTLTSADFTFGDGKSQTGVKPANATTVTVTHDYATGGTYNALATLHFSYAGHTYTAPTCRALVKPTTIVSECKPGVPTGSPECTPCQYDSTLPANSPQCTPPCTTDTDTGNSECTLPNTGAGNTIAIFAAVVVGGFLLYRHVLYRQHKAAFAAAETGTSALPLADPTAPNDPLRDTPLEPKKRSFRRRQF